MHRSKSSELRVSISVASPWLHQAGFKYHLESEKEKRPINCDLIEEIQFSVYMDDISFGGLKVSEAFWKAKKSVEIFDAGHFPLRKWACNSAALAERLDKLLEGSAEVKFDEDNFKYLGVKWCQVKDMLGVFTEKAVKSLKVSEPTKRSLLSGLARVFDDPSENFVAENSERGIRLGPKSSRWKFGAVQYLHSQSGISRSLRGETIVRDG